MAVYQIFPTNIVIEDIELTEEQTSDLIVAIESIFFHNYQATREDARLNGAVPERGNCADTIPVFTPENLNIFPILKDIKEIFIDGFYELAKVHKNSNLTREVISNLLAENHGQLPILRRGQNMPAHTHPGTAASALFYLTDIDNEKEGGQLVLRDPTWHATPGFRNSMEYEVETRAGRLVVFPVHVWHEVKTYFGEKDRISIVTNLSYMNKEFMKSVDIEEY